MTAAADPEPGHDPCLQIQVDLSAMVDGELDPAAVRRVMVHSDVCAQCRSFLDGIRHQARLHQQAATVAAEAGDQHGPSERQPATVLSHLREQLTANRHKLSRVLYELGRGFALMGLSADFSREVAKEPVPVPDMAMRGRNLLDEISREGGAGAEWVAAKELFDGQLRSPDQCLARGQRLLSECLALDPDFHDARIYLGLVHYVHGQRALARRQFLEVLGKAEDRRTRGYALLNLSNIHLDEGDAAEAVRLLQQLVDSGVIADHPNLSTAYFNLGLALGLDGRFQDCARWFQRLACELPHKRAWMAREVGRRSQFVHLIRNHPEAKVVADAFPGLFAPRPAG
jgi:tetratricopeptide (TPR) repeat protein